MPTYGIYLRYNSVPRVRSAPHVMCGLHTETQYCMYSTYLRPGRYGNKTGVIAESTSMLVSAVITWAIRKAVELTETRCAGARQLQTVPREVYVPLCRLRHCHADHCRGLDFVLCWFGTTSRAFRCISSEFSPHSTTRPDPLILTRLIWCLAKHVPYRGGSNGVSWRTGASG